jgi:Arc/MetJ family transcription regulator
MAFVGNMGTSSGILNMRTTIEIDERLIRKAMRVSGAKTKRATVEAALRLLVQTKAQAGMQRLRGKVDWDGDLEESRLGRVIR